MEDYSKQAKKAVRERDYQRAGDFYFMSHDYKNALKMYLKDDNYELAAKVCEEIKDFDSAIYYIEKTGNYAKAAELANTTGDYRKAIEFYERSENYFQAADLAEKTKDYVKAGEVYTKFGDYTKAAKCFIQAGEYARALELIKILISQRRQIIADKNISEEIDNIIKSYKNKAAELHQKMEQYNESAQYLLEIEDFQKAAYMYTLANQPEEAFKVYLNNGFADSALDEYLKHPNKIQADDKTLAALFSSAGNHTEAAKHYLNINMLSEAAEAYNKGGDIRRAAELYSQNREFRKAIELLTEQGFYLDAVEIYAAYGRYKEAAALAEERGLFAKAAEYYEQSNSILKAAQMYEQYGNLQDAARLYLSINDREKAVELYKANPDAFSSPEIIREMLIEERKFIEAANISMTLNDVPRAAELFRLAKAYSEAGELFASLRNHKNAAEMFLSGNEIEKAAKHFELEKNYEKAGDCYLNLLRYHKAADCYMTAHKYMLAAQVYYNLKDLDRTVNVLQKIKPTHENYTQASFQLGKIFHTQLFYNLAKIKLEESLQDENINHENIEKYYILADCMVHMGKYDEALRFYDIILSYDFNYRDALALRDKTDIYKKDNKPIAPNLEETIAVVDLLQLKEGDMIARRFKILGELGAGGMGKVYKAHDNELEEIIAVKILFTQFGNYEEEKRHLVNEIKIARKISHPYIIKVFDIGDWLGNKFFTMQYVEGIDLAEWHSKNGSTSYKQKLVLIKKICEGLKAAHDMNVIHRDIKPKNILVTANNNPIILDFGIAEAMNAYLRTTQGHLVGSPNYMSPEQISDKDYDHRTDIYSLGCVLYEMFTDRKPYISKDITQLFMAKLDHNPRRPKELVPELPEAIEEIILKALQKNYQQRYPNMRAMISDINLFLATKGGNK